MKFLEARVYQSRRGSSCSRVFGLASTAGLTNCLWMASSKAPSTPFCHCLLTNAPRLPLPDTCLLPTFCSVLSDGLLCIRAWLTMSCFISTAAGSPASDRVVSHSQLWSVSKLPNAFSSLPALDWDYCAKNCVLFSQSSPYSTTDMNGGCFSFAVAVMLWRYQAMFYFYQYFFLNDIQVCFKMEGSSILQIYSDCGWKGMFGNLLSNQRIEQHSIWAF